MLFLTLKKIKTRISNELKATNIFALSTLQIFERTPR